MYRDDGKALGDVWSEVVFEKDLMWAIREGYLIAPHGKTIAIQGLNQLASIRSVRGDYNQTELADVMNASVDSTVDAILRHCPDSAMIVFAAGVKHAATLAGKLTAAGIPARDVTGAHKRDYREEAYSDFREGRINCLVTVQVLTEGADFPRCDTVVLARPTRSKVLLCFDSATEILTSRGWVNGMELENDDQVAQWSGTTEEIIFTAPLHYFSRAVEDGERMVSLNLPATSIRVTEDHRVYFRPKGAPEHAGWRVSPASELADKSKRQVLIPSAGMSKFNGIPLTDDEIRLIAWVTTDGGIRKDNLAYVSQSKASNVPEIERIIQACGIKYGTHVDSKPTNFGARSHPLVRYSMSLGKPRGRDSHLRGWGYLEKWMFKTNPRFKTEGSSEVQSRWEDVSSDQWDVFMNTLDAANGANTTVDNLGWTPRSMHVSLSSLPFAEWVQAMCVQRGWSTSLTQHTGRTGLWMLHAKKITRRVVGGSDGRPTWTYEDPDPYEKVWCVTVPSGAVVTRRKGKVTILGQCQIIGRAVRPYTDSDGFEKDTALVLDLTGVVRDAKLTSLTDLYPEAKREVYTEDGEEVTGTDKDPTLAPPEKERKGILQLEDIDLVEGGAPFRSKVLWMKSDPLNTDGDEIAFMPLRYPRQYVFLYPPLNRVTDKGVMLGRLDANRGITFVTDPSGNIVRGNIAEAMTAAEQIVGSTGYIRKDAQWRKPSVKPSDSQKSLAKNLNIDVDPNMLNKAELSDLITLRLAKPLLADVVRRTGYPLE
jgi:hypothetical protein